MNAKLFCFLFCCIESLIFFSSSKNHNSLEGHSEYIKVLFWQHSDRKKEKDVLRSDPSVRRPILSDHSVKRLILSKPDCVETRSDVWLRHLAKRRLTTDDERRFRTTKTCETRISSLIRRTDRILTILRKVSGRQSVRVVRNCWWESSNSPTSLSSMPTLVCSTTKWGLMSFGLRRRRLRRTGPIWGTARGTVPAPQAGEQTRLPVSEI